MEIILFLLIVCLSSWLGLKFPDWDLKLGIKHRSLLTHSPLILVPFIVHYLKVREEFLGFFISGFSIGIAVHLLFDGFPKSWKGTALLCIGKITFRAKMSQMLLLLFFIVLFLIPLFILGDFLKYLFILGVGLFWIIKLSGKEGVFFSPAFIYMFMSGSVYLIVERINMIF